MATVGEIGGNAYRFVTDNVKHPRLDSVDLKSLLHTFDEAGAWPDLVDSVSYNQAILCWRVVERVRQLNGSLPDNCKL